MAPAAQALAWMLAGTVLGAVVTALARAYALRLRLIDLPGERRSHQAATPRGGGVSIVLVLLAAGGILAVVAPGERPACLLAGAGLLLVAGIGWLDDHRPLPAWPRLCVHALSAALLAAAAWSRGGDALDVSVAFASALVLVNVWNFMDGIDGIAAMQALVVAVAWAMLAGAGPVWWLGLALAAGALGFLPFNFPRARIFLGDVGSGALGYGLAMLFTVGSQGGGPVARVLWVLPLLPFLVDASLTLALRILAGEAWWRPHVRHAYQVWARALGSHVPVTLAYAAAAVLASMLMFLVRSGTSVIIIAACSTFLAVGALAWNRLRGASPVDGSTDELGRRNR